MPRGKPAKQICIRIDPDLLAAIDVDLGGEAKTAWMSSAFRIKLGWEAVKGGPAPPAEPLESAKRADADQRRVQAEKITENSRGSLRLQADGGIGGRR